jgi:DNA mismatch repair protein MutS
MGGKSTYLRQTALIVLMAQSGCFVPATFASIGIIDQLFSRIGAQDDLYAGQSTFMVEMSEVAYILNHATFKSLIILDEVGRGTATYDGLAIAWAVSEYLLNQVKGKTLFATHYHELTQLSGVHNKTVKVEEFEGQIRFFHQIIDGKAYKSYGIQVAKLAGLPDLVLAKARHKLAEMEAVFKFDLQKVG